MDTTPNDPYDKMMDDAFDGQEEQMEEIFEPQDDFAEMAHHPEPVQYTAPTSSEERTWSMLMHLSGLAWMVFPFGGILAPLILWQVKKEEMPSIEAHAKNSINFQISMGIWLLASLVLTLIAIGAVGLVVFGIMSVVVPIIAGVKANEGKMHKYPMTIQFLK